MRGDEESVLPTYLVSVNVGGAIALAGVVTTEITQKPPGQP